jgi:hypothetical protein
VQQIEIGRLITHAPFLFAGYTAGLAVDAPGELLASSNAVIFTSQDAVYAYASPTTGPRRIRTLTGSGISNPQGLAVDALNELYVENSGGTSSFVAAYPATANGNPRPDREITIVGQRSFGTGIATSAGVMFVPDPAANAVYELSATAGGNQTPISTLSVPSPEDAKLGS